MTRTTSTRTRTRMGLATLALLAGLTLSVGACGDAPSTDTETGETPAVVDVEAPEVAAETPETTPEIEPETLVESFDVTDAARFEELAREMGLEVVALEGVTPHRGSGDEEVFMPTFPRGDVRIGDLSDIRIDVGLDFEPGGMLRFKKGSKVLWEGPFDPEEITTIMPIPDEVIAAIEKGDRITWGYFPERGKSMTAKFKVVEPNLEKRWKSISKRIDPTDEMLVKQFRAQLYLDKGLAQAAFQEASEVGKATESAAAWNIARAALRKLDLDDTGLWQDTLEALQNAKSTPKKGDPGRGAGR